MKTIVLSILTIFLLFSLAQATKVCPNCGQECPDDWNYCDKCVVNGKGVLLVDKDGDGAKSKTVGPGIKLVRIPGGTFQMGSNEGDADEKPVHPVTVNSFYMGETEVTIAQYVAFLNEESPSESERKQWIAINGENSWYYTGKEWKQGVNSNCHISYSAGRYYADAGWEERPVVNVSWYGADAFCSHYKLSLPTEAEWEYAAGGPNHYKFPWGNEWDKNACCNSENQGSGTPPTKRVGGFPPNGYGLYDMAGNVWEWCADWYGEYSYRDSNNPKGPSTGTCRVLRGGSWLDDAPCLRCAYRYIIDPAIRIDSFGFRVSGD